MAEGSGAANFDITIDVIDKATKAIRGVKKTVGDEIGKLTNPLKDIFAATGKLADETGLPKLGEHAKGAFEHIKTLGEGIHVHLLEPLSRLPGLTAAFGAFAGIASIGGVFEFAKSAAETRANLLKASLKTGIAVPQLARIHYAEQMAEVDPDVADKAFGLFAAKIADAASGRDKKAAGYLRAMHISPWASKGHLADPGALLPTILDRFAMNPDTDQRNNAAKALFSRGGIEIMPFLVMGKKRVAELGEEFRRLHGDISRADAVMGAEAVESWRQLDVATSGLTDTIGIALLPTIKTIIEPLRDWIANNRELIGIKVGEWARDAGTWLKSIDWHQVGKDALQFFKDSKEIVGDLLVAFRGVKSTFEWLVGHQDDIKNLSVVGAVMDLANPTNLSRNGQDIALIRKFILSSRDAPDRPRVLPDLFPSTDTPKKGFDAARIKQAVGFFESKGWSASQAAGIVANLVYESGLDPHRSGDQGQAYGSAQWHRERAELFAQFAGTMHWANRSLVGSTLGQQLEFVQWELTHSEKRAGDALKRIVGDAGRSTTSVLFGYERPQDPSASAHARVAIADAIMALVGRQSDSDQDQPIQAIKMPLVSAHRSAGDGGSTGTVDVNLNLNGLPSGSKVSAKQRGDTSAINFNLGRAWTP
ncbi:MAG TPA: phage tail tip lysozyme [Rhizomicrobium sp.]|jgi:hypothetical protein